MDVVQCRMAKAALDWQSADLADASQLELRSVSRFERGGAVLPGQLRAMRQAFETHGVEFLDGGGVRLIWADSSQATRRSHAPVQRAL